MRNTLQYVYSISVLIGVLACSYFMVDQGKSSRLPLQVSEPSLTLRKDAGVSSPAFNGLFEIEKALSERGKEEKSKKEKAPASVFMPPLPAD